MTRPPRSISGSAGSRIKLLLGETGSDYLYFFDEDNGDSQWQSRGWSVATGGLPNDLAKQLNNVSAKGRYVKEVSFGPNGEWFVNGEKRDGTGEHSWWGGCNNASEDIKQLTTGDSGHRLRLCFGPSSTTYLIVQGNHGYSGSWNLDDGLLSRLKEINRRKGKVKIVKMFPGGGYFISDDGGMQWQGLNSHLEKEIRKPGAISDVVVASDGSWVIIRPNHYVSSTGVSEEVKNLLLQFFNRHKKCQNARSLKIRQYIDTIKCIAQIKKECDARIKKEHEAAECAARLKAEREKLIEEAAKSKRATNDCLESLRKKRLKVGDRVTALDISESPGDLIVKHISPEGALDLYSSNRYCLVCVNDPSQLSLYEDDEEDVEKVNLLCFAVDKYEAAISLFQCKCFANGICLCKRTSANPGGSMKLALRVGDRVNVIGFANATIIRNEPHNTNSTNRLHVRYDDGSTYYCKRETLRPLESLNLGLPGATSS